MNAGKAVLQHTGGGGVPLGGGRGRQTHRQGRGPIGAQLLGGPCGAELWGRGDGASGFLSIY